MDLAKLLVHVLQTYVLVFLLLAGLVLCGEDFYKLLGVQRGASTREIRKAFKKMAVSMHPDKNTDDPTAHEKFIKINRAYEVLKDDDLRKKYDMHGEEGLSEDKQRGGHYESWRFYQEEFGIYDDDPEIITLSKSDFELSVEGTEDIWFINFYSPHCSHCHDLAPTWRDVARDLEGVIRIGAVNCEDDWHLCRNQGIRSYPSLLMYPAKEKYMGEKSQKELVKYAMKHLKVKVFELWRGNFEDTVKNAEKELPWLITFCGDGGDCLLSSTCMKLAAMLDELVNVGIVDCHDKNSALCEQLGADSGTYFYQGGEVQKNHGVEITSLVAQEIASNVLAQLPDVTNLGTDTFMAIQEKLKTGQDHAWLLHFVEGTEGHDLEFRKLPAMLPDFKVGRVDCSQMRTTCNGLHIHKFPAFLVFKETGGYEIHYGRSTAHDVAAFARDSSITKLRALELQDFENHMVGPNSPDAWFVDFFAPWCPPCMRLLPEFRKAAKSYGNVVNFGTVDCTIHDKLCNMYNIRSYPTTILYNITVPHQYHGHHNVRSIGEFIKDTLKPPVMTLDYNSFRRNVLDKAVDDIWLVDFFAPWCGPCQQLAPEWRRLAKMLKDVNGIHVAQVDCQEHGGLCREQGINSYPTMWLYPPGTTASGSHYQYSGWHRDAESLRAWVYEFLPSKVTELSWSNFYQEVLSSSKPWIIDFYTPWCGHCQVFKPEFEKVAEKLEGIAKAGKVNCDREPQLCQQASVHAYPSVRFYQGADHEGQSQNVYGWDINSQDARQIIQFVKNNVHQEQIPHDEL